MKSRVLSNICFRRLLSINLILCGLNDGMPDIPIFILLYIIKSLIAYCNKYNRLEIHLQGIIKLTYTNSNIFKKKIKESILKVWMCFYYKLLYANLSCQFPLIYYVDLNRLIFLI